MNEFFIGFVGSCAFATLGFVAGRLTSAASHAGQIAMLKSKLFYFRCDAQARQARMRPANAKRAEAKRVRDAVKTAERHARMAKSAAKFNLVGHEL